MLISVCSTLSSEGAAIENWSRVHIQLACAAVAGWRLHTTTPLAQRITNTSMLCVEEVIQRNAWGQFPKECTPAVVAQICCLPHFILKF